MWCCCWCHDRERWPAPIPTGCMGRAGRPDGFCAGLGGSRPGANLPPLGCSAAIDTEVEDPKVMINRRRTRLGAVLVGASLLTGAGAALSACSAGQVTQTDAQVAAVPGVNVDS